MFKVMQTVFKSAQAYAFSTVNKPIFSPEAKTWTDDVPMINPYTFLALMVTRQELLQPQESGKV